MGQQSWGEYAKEAEKTGGFSLLPIGQHNIKVDTAQVKQGKAGHNQILARLVVTDGPSMGGSILNNMAPYKNNGDPNGFFFQGLAALGLGRTEAAEWWAQLDLMNVDESLEQIAQAMVGREATITVDHEQYNNVMRDNVKKMAPKGAPMPGAGIPGAVPFGGPPAVPIPNQPIAPAAATPVAPAAVPAAVTAPAAAVTQPVAPPVSTTAPVAPAAPQTLAPPPAVAANQPAPSPSPTAAPTPAPAVVPPAQAPVAPVVPPVVAGEQALVRPDEAPF